MNGKISNNIEGVVIHKNNDRLTYSLNFKNLARWLKELEKNSSFSKIILLRQYKVPYNITYLLTDKLGLNLKDIRDKILKPYLIYYGSILKDKLSKNDIRKILYTEYLKTNPNTEIKNPLIANFPNLLSYTSQLEEYLNNYLDFEDLKNYGLMNNSYNINIDENMYQNLYNYISAESNISNTIKNISFDFELKKTENKQTKEYLLMLHFIVTNFFNDMEFYKSTNLTRYSYKDVPSLLNIINFINSTDTDKLEEEFNTIIKNNILEKDKYIDSILHHLIITPYLVDSNYIEMLENKVLIKKIIIKFDGILNKIWNNTEDDVFNKVDPKLILKEWKDVLYKVNQQNKLEVKNNLLIDV